MESIVAGPLSVRQSPNTQSETCFFYLHASIALLTNTSGRMCRALVTCIDEESVETDFEVEWLHNLSEGLRIERRLVQHVVLHMMTCFQR